jgi:hypothetical protein
MRAAALASLAAAAMIAGCGSDESTTPSESSGPQPPASAGASSVPPGSAARTCASDGRLSELRVSGLGCTEGRTVVSAWNRPGCRPSGGDSRSACTVRGYRCLAVVVDRGLSVDCARPGKSISFLRRR